MSIQDLLKKSEFPLFTCPGCTHGTVLNAFLRAFEHAGINRDKTVLCCAIGCAGRTPTLLDFNVLRVTHGRALAYATGVKLSRPDMKVVVFMGDGDSLAIGGNHFIHAARRNIDLTAIIFRNEIYGMTGGQYAPTTPQGGIASTSPYGMIEPSFDSCKLAVGSGATFVARGDVYHVNSLKDVIEKAILHKGFSVVEALTSCPTQFGRRNKVADPTKMVERIKNMTRSKAEAAKMTEEELQGKFITGIFVDRQEKELTERYSELLKKVRSAQGKE